VSDLDLVRFRRVLEEALRRFPDAEFLLDVRLLLDKYERLLVERKLAERYDLRATLRKTVDQIREDLQTLDEIREAQIRDAHQD
jgi:hypothetical protein